MQLRKPNTKGVIAWVPQDGMVHATESHHLKGECFSVVVEGITEGNGHINLPHRCWYKLNAH
jgi:hypothetical protein